LEGLRKQSKHLHPLRVAQLGNTTRFIRAALSEIALGIGMSIDEIDSKILKRVLADARLSYRKIADQIGVSAPTVLSRINKLEYHRIIKSYSAIVDHEKLGYDLTAIIEVTAQKGKIVEVERAISKFPNVCAVYDITGLTDMIIIAKFRNRRELSNFVKRDLALPSIERTNSHVVLVTVKENFSFF
jgi:DNA-binding Lrp family transcriptional regulator